MPKTRLQSSDRRKRPKMGNNESNPIRNLDKRTARRQYRAQFARAIAEYRFGSSCSRGQAEQKPIPGDGGGVRVCVRKRPIFRHEIDNSEFDCITASGGGVVVHDARMHADMRRLMMSHHTFLFDGVFDEFASSESVYSSICLPLVHDASTGGMATCIVSGQTGSGKTYTMSSFYQQASRDVFSILQDQTERFQLLPTVSVTFIELHGDTCMDLLNGFAQVSLLTAADQSVQPFPVVEVTVESAESLKAMIQHGVSIRSTEATGVHNSSSRSHAILRIYIRQGQDREGCLTLVDLAGSEQNIDSMYHTADRRKEGALINSSLLALKECVRARAGNNPKSSAFGRSFHPFPHQRPICLKSSCGTCVVSCN